MIHILYVTNTTFCTFTRICFFCFFFSVKSLNAVITCWVLYYVLKYISINQAINIVQPFHISTIFDFTNLRLSIPVLPNLPTRTKYRSLVLFVHLSDPRNQ